MIINAVDVSVTVTHITTTAATLNATCTKLLYSSHIESISILVRDQQYTVQCDGPHSPIRCSPLLRNTQYNVTTIIRFGAVDEKCPITNFTTPNSCEYIKI